tara:strand:- start:12729 stop:13259 length:531 start_codon:yes stop_codon:yes gene_type:complete
MTITRKDMLRELLPGLNKLWPSGPASAADESGGDTPPLKDLSWEEFVALYNEGMEAGFAPSRVKDSGWLVGGEEPSLPFSNGDTSLDAAKSARKTAGLARTRVFRLIVQSGNHGMTDDEIERVSGIIGSTSRPRRRELFLAGKIELNGEKRLTRRGRFANVYIAKPISEEVLLDET